MLDADVRAELRGLTPEVAARVARHLVVAGRLLDEEPVDAYAHARAARSLAGRIAIVREAAGLAAYHAGEYADALAELRAARRMSGSPEHVAVIADCERALGRPGRAIDLAAEVDPSQLDAAAYAELLIVVSGARRDLGQAEAAVVALERPALSAGTVQPWTARLWYAYAEALLAAGRTTQAREWFAAVAGIDEEEETDAAERVLALAGAAGSLPHGGAG